MTDLSVGPAGPGRWPAVVAVLGTRRTPDSCWCQRFRTPEPGDHRSSLEREIRTSAVPVGLVAEVDGVPAGWSRVVPRRSLAGIEQNRALRKLVSPLPEAWWVACFVVRREFRGNGVGVALLRAAVDWAGGHGAVVVEGHPVDTDGLATRPSPAAVFTGTVPMFRAAGFAEVGRTYPTRPVMRRVLAAHTTDSSARINPVGGVGGRG